MPSSQSWVSPKPGRSTDRTNPRKPFLKMIIWFLGLVKNEMVWVSHMFILFDGKSTLPSWTNPSLNSVTYFETCDMRPDPNYPGTTSATKSSAITIIASPYIDTLLGSTPQLGCQSPPGLLCFLVRDPDLNLYLSLASWVGGRSNTLPTNFPAKQLPWFLFFFSKLESLALKQIVAFPLCVQLARGGLAA